MHVKTVILLGYLSFGLINFINLPTTFLFLGSTFLTSMLLSVFNRMKVYQIKIKVYKNAGQVKVIGGLMA